ncbi:MAG: 16S rRNA (guanine(1207)-N(2))-methyltransferase RsmC [Vibrio sp.]
MANYTAPSQIAERQIDYFADKHVLVAGEAEDHFPQQLLQHSASVTIFTTDYRYSRQWDNSDNIQCHFSEELSDDVTADLVLLYWPKSKKEATYLLAMLMSKLGVGTEIVVVGENRSGVKSIEKLFKEYGSVQKYDSARRCSFYWGQCENVPTPFDINDWFKSYTVEYQGKQITIRSLPGVFSHGELDIGSRLLIDALPNLTGKVLDFGCGAGVIGTVMLTLNPNIELNLCDISALAIRSSQETLAANGLTADVFASDIYSDINDEYQFIVTNPPFHSGLETSYDTTETLLARAPQSLVKRGQLFVVANSFLKYSPIIEKSFGACQTLSKTKKFVIHHAIKRR